MAELSEIFLGADFVEENNAPATKRLETVSSRAMISLGLELSWASSRARHTECLYVAKSNMWRDIFPPALEAGLPGKAVGDVVSVLADPGELVPAQIGQDCFNIASGAFNRRYRKHNYIEPRDGRFYPRGFIAGSHGIYPEERTPFRVGQVGERISVDLNHPLATQPLQLTARVADIWEAGAEHGGACQDIAELATINGPGMQVRWQDHPTDFFSDLPFARLAGEVDSLFYEEPRLVHHLDSRARRQISQLYGRLIPSGGRVLDLMSSWASHLPEGLEVNSLVGLGMNAEELASNPRLSDSLVHDLNLQPTLPFDDASFDAVICTVSVEYLIKPQEVFAEVARVLRPGGRFVLTFSDRWFPPKVIRIWQDIHPFERLGLVLEYFLRDGGFTDLETWSSRGLPRPADDKYADRMAHSDPVFAVWGTRS